MKRIFLLVLFIFCAALSSCNNQQNVYKIEYMSEPCFIPISNNRWKICDNMIVHVDDTYHVIPRGFKTDLASIPRIFWSFYSPVDFDSIASAVLHDWHYCCSFDVSRKDADLIFYYGLIAQGMPKLRASLYYYCVRSWGWIFYTRGLGLADHMHEFDSAEMKGVYKDVNY